MHCIRQGYNATFKFSYSLFPTCFCRNNTESAELVSHYESSLSLPDILPIPSKTYDKNRAPKLLGQPTVVYFHVTVLSLDSINEESMVCLGYLGITLCIFKSLPSTLFTDLCDGHIFSTKLARSASAFAREHERAVSHSRRGLAAQHLASRLFL